MGRGADIFSISIAIAFASKIPTQMGITVSDANVLENDDGHIRSWIHHQTANPNLDIHGFPFPLGSR